MGNSITPYQERIAPNAARGSRHIRSSLPFVAGLPDGIVISHCYLVIRDTPYKYSSPSANKISLNHSAALTLTSSHPFAEDLASKTSTVTITNRSPAQSPRWRSPLKFIAVEWSDDQQIRERIRYPKQR